MIFKIGVTNQIQDKNDSLLGMKQIDFFNVAIFQFTVGDFKFSWSSQGVLQLVNP